MGKMRIERREMIRGMIIYAAGDTVAAVILGQYSILRMLGIMLIGATVYALEIPNYFQWIELKTATSPSSKRTFQRTVLAILYFNPLWIARHLFLINFFSGQWQNINLSLLRAALYSFLLNMPLALAANFVIQNRVPLKWRFLASATFSASMAVYYAVSDVVFR